MAKIQKYFVKLKNYICRRAAGLGVDNLAVLCYTNVV
jgi:hypothetical protein